MSCFRMQTHLDIVARSACCSRRAPAADRLVMRKLEKLTRNASNTPPKGIIADPITHTVFNLVLIQRAGWPFLSLAAGTAGPMHRVSFGRDAASRAA